MKKIIACLDIKDGRVVKGVQFAGLKDQGDPIELAQSYDEAGIDEIVCLDISRTIEGHDLMIDLIQDLSQAIPQVPLTVGGGIQELDDIDRILQAGAHQVSIGSKAVKDPDFIHQAVEAFGAQAICVAIDVQADETGQYYIYSRAGQEKEDIFALDFIRQMEDMGAGRLLITSIQADGGQSGFDLDFLKTAQANVNIPIIASGGAGNIQDFIDLFEQTEVPYGLAASIFHQGKVDISELKQVLQEEGLNE